MKKKKNSAPELTMLQATRILEDVFRDCEVEPNSVPLEALTAYSNYRKERFFLQKGILLGIVVALCILPVCFVAPHFKLTLSDQGTRGLPICLINLSSHFPVKSVTAVVEDKDLPVYEINGSEYSVEPVKNGTLKVTVKLSNNQEVTQDIQVSQVDSVAPTLVSCTTDGSEVVSVYVEDEGIGVDYKDIYAETDSGEKIEPKSYDADKGLVVFSYPQEEWEVYVPDYLGNTLHFMVTLEE